MAMRKILFFCFLWAFSGNLKAQSPELNLIKSRIVAELFANPADDRQVGQALSHLKEDGSFNNIDYSDLSTTAGFPQGRHTSDLAQMAKAYQSPTSTYYKSSLVKEAVIRGLNYWIQKDYVGDNWHDNQITTPTNLINVVVAIGQDLPRELLDQLKPIIGRANMTASGARPSGDRIVIAGILAKNMLFLGNESEFNAIIRIIESDMKFANGERGMQQDYSFHHRPDRVNNTISYGYSKFANTYGEWVAYVGGTKFQFSKEKINQLVDYYLDGVYKQLVYGVYEDVGVKNRDITNKSAWQPRGTLEIDRMLAATDHRKKELQEIKALRKGESKPTASFAKFFWQTEHFVFQRPHFYTSVRMFSTRNQNMEQPYNGPGKTTAHRADGTNYLSLKGDEYHGIWPVYNWQKISGTTIMQKSELPGPKDIQKEGLTEFVGAVTDDLYGAVAFDFKSPHDLLEAKKSWFFFDEEYVCLGAGIKPKKSLPVYTTINQVLMRSEVRIEQNGLRQSLPKGNRAMEQVKWVYQDRVGYLFPTQTKINISNQPEKGRWADITDQKNISKDIISEDVFSLWFDHGNKINATDIHGKRLMDQVPSYAYIVVPNVTEEALAASSTSNRNIEILANSEQVQAVKHTKLGRVQAAFYQAGSVDIAPGQSLKLGSQGMVMLQMQGNRLAKISVSDPSRRLAQVLVTSPGIYAAKGEGFSCFPNKSENKTLWIIDLPQGAYAGKSATISIQ
jgi:chondroitin AC lyase